MKYHSILKKAGTILLALVIIFSSVMRSKTYPMMTKASEKFTFIVLSSYGNTLKIGQSFYLTGIASNGKMVRYKSSNSRIASVNTYGKVTAKKAGNCMITAYTGGAEASCRITVQKTEITLNAKTLSLENGASYTFRASTSNGSQILWKSSKKSVASIDEHGKVETYKPGETTITASADGSKQTCRLTVRKPVVTLNRTNIRLYRQQSFQLEAKVSSGRVPSFSSRKSSVAIIDEKGVITAKKHGTTQICAKIDGATRTCEVTVMKPDIQLTPTKATLKKGQVLSLSVKVSSGITPAFSSSKKTVATVDSRGKIRAVGKGSCYIYATEDGTKESCRINVTN